MRVEKGVPRVLAPANRIRERPERTGGRPRTPPTNDGRVRRSRAKRPGRPRTAGRTRQGSTRPLSAGRDTCNGTDRGVVIETSGNGSPRHRDRFGVVEVAAGDSAAMARYPSWSCQNSVRRWRRGFLPSRSCPTCLQDTARKAVDTAAMVAFTRTVCTSVAIRTVYERFLRGQDTGTLERCRQWKRPKIPRSPGGSRTAPTRLGFVARVARRRCRRRAGHLRSAARAGAAIPVLG